MRGIIARFTRQRTREEWLQKKSNLKDHSESTFVQENLTKYQRELLKETKSRDKAKTYQFAWHTNGKILVRKAQGAHAIQIKSRDELHKL